MVSTAAYFRVSTGQQSMDQQHDAIAAAGITPDRVFTDTASVARAVTDPAGASAWAGSAKAINWSSSLWTGSGCKTYPTSIQTDKPANAQANIASRMVS